MAVVIIYPFTMKIKIFHSSALEPAQFSGGFNPDNTCGAIQMKAHFTCVP